VSTRLIVVLMTFLVGCVVQPVSSENSNNLINSDNMNSNVLVEDSHDELNGRSIIIMNAALESYTKGYMKEPSHKAFAQSEQGTWTWKSKRTSKEHAINNALSGCKDKNAELEAKYPCIIINVDGKWVGQ